MRRDAIECAFLFRVFFFLRSRFSNKNIQGVQFHVGMVRRWQFKQQLFIKINLIDYLINYFIIQINITRNV